MVRAASPDIDYTLSLYPTPGGDRPLPSQPFRTPPRPDFPGRRVQVFQTSAAIGGLAGLVERPDQRRD